MTVVDFSLLSSSNVREHVKNLAKKGDIVFSRHAERRMEERGITYTNVMSCLIYGIIDHKEPLHTDAGGNWKINLERRCAGKIVKVVASIKTVDNCIIVTVI